MIDHRLKLYSTSKYSNSWICKNTACKALMSGTDTFCRNCSCCICHRFDDNRDPSLWLVCGSQEDPHDSCGLTCHVECAFKHGKVGVIDLEESMQLDGGYCCASCGKHSEILGFLKKQLVIAKDAHRVDALCRRLSLSYRLLSAAPRYRDILDIVQSARIKLKSHVGPINDVSRMMGRSIVSKLPVGIDVQKLCADAIEKVDLWLTNSSKTGSISKALILDLNVESVPPFEPSRDEGNGRTSAQDVGAEVSRKRTFNLNKEKLDCNGTPINGSSSKKPRVSDEKFEENMKIIQRLEREGLIDMEFVTWFGSRSTERERSIVNVYIQTFMGHLKDLAGQLVHTFSKSVSSKRSGN